MEANRGEEPQSDTELKLQKAKLEKLGRVVRVLLTEEPVKTQRALESHDIADLEVFLQDVDASGLEAAWDTNDRVYRCPQCMWELEQGVCSSGCQLEFDMDLQDDADYTSNEALNPDRVSQSRGGTPLQDVDQQYLVPCQYSGDDGFVAYDQLRRRGATRLMCETFQLEFHSDVGIVAWADSVIYEEFAGPLMQQGDFWKIMLGRRIQLDEDDPDGSAFIEALLEDAVVFPLISTCEWETVEESPGIWVTRATGITPQRSSSPSPSGDVFSDDSHTSPNSRDARVDAFELERQLADQALEPGYIHPSLPVNADHYEASDGESDVEMSEEESITAEGDEEEEGGCASDSGWAWEANVPDAGWMEESEDDEDELEGEDDDEMLPELGDGEIDQLKIKENGLDSADSDFDSDEVLTGDESIFPMAQGQCSPVL